MLNMLSNVRIAIGHTHSMSNYSDGDCLIIPKIIYITTQTAAIFSVGEAKRLVYSIFGKRDRNLNLNISQKTLRVGKKQ